MTTSSIVTSVLSLVINGFTLWHMRKTKRKLDGK